MDKGGSLILSLSMVVLSPLGPIDYYWEGSSSDKDHYQL